MARNLYLIYTGVPEKRVLELLSQVPWLEEQVEHIFYKDQTMGHDGAMKVGKRRLLVEVQHLEQGPFKRNGICLDIISALVMPELRGAQIPGNEAITFLSKLAKNPGISKWGKFLHSAFDSDLIAIRVTGKGIFIYSTRRISQKIPYFLGTYGFRFNDKKKQRLPDTWESAFIPVNHNDPKLIECHIESYSQLEEDLNSHLPKFCQLDFN